jgi:hypothetical protein
MYGEADSQQTIYPENEGRVNWDFKWRKQRKRRDTITTRRRKRKPKKSRKSNSQNTPKIKEA